MKHLTRTAAGLGTAVALAVPTALVVAAPAHADVERRGACGAGNYELSVDREDGGYEVSVDVDRVAPDVAVARRDAPRRPALLPQRAARRPRGRAGRRPPACATRPAATPSRFRAKRLGHPVACSARVSVR